MRPNEQKIRLKGIAHVFFGFVSQFSQFQMKFWFSFRGFTKVLESYGIDSLTKGVIDFVMSIKWIVLSSAVSGQLMAVKTLKKNFDFFKISKS